MDPEHVDRRLTTIVAIDVVGYSRLMAVNETSTLAQLKSHRKELVEPKVAQYHGRTIKLMGDGTLLEFASVVDAVAFAVEVQCAVQTRNVDIPEDQQIAYRIGVNIGDIIVEGDDIYGDGVNIAARLEGLAEPGGVCISRPVHTQIKGKLDLNFEHLGEKEVKNIPEPVTVYRVVFDDMTAALVTPIRQVASRPLRRWWPVASAVVVAIILTVGSLLWWQIWAPDVEPAAMANMAFPLPNKPSIAVLPFTNMSGNPEQEYFTDGMTEDLITDLSKISGLFVIARNSSFSYKGQQVKIREVAEELGVRYVLEGSVRRVGQDVRINAQLIDATTGGHLWAERYDGTMDGVFRLQDRVTEQIVTALAVSLTGEEQAVQARQDTDNIAAHDAFLQGWSHYKLLTRADLKRALPFLKEAVRLDPGYAQAHAALASVYWDAYKNDWAFDIKLPSFDAESLANEHLQKTVNSPTPLAHALQSSMFASAGLYREAVEEAEKAVALDGNDATSQAGLANALVLAGRPLEAIGPIRTAMRLDPHHPPRYLITLGAAQFAQERYEEAASTFERAIKRNPGNELPLIYLASSYGHRGQIKKAEDAIKKLNKVRFEQGLGELSLRDPSTFPYRVVDRRDSHFDLSRFGQGSARERVRAGLADIPALTWQYRITWIRSLEGSEVVSLQVDGASEVNIDGAKALYDRGAIFIDVSSPEIFDERHISRSINLPFYRSADPSQQHFTLETLSTIADKKQKLVLFCDSKGCLYPAWATAKAANWGYQNVFFFKSGTQAWEEAGYFVEKRE